MARHRWLRRVLIALAALAGLVVVGFWVLLKFFTVTAPDPYAPRQPDLTIGPAALAVEAGELRHTVVVAHLDAPIVKDQNLVWCATAQIAWNELCGPAGGPVHMTKEPPLVALLNRQDVDSQDLDESALVAMAGPGGPAMAKRLRKEIGRKFGAGFAPKLLAMAEAAPPGELAVYACFRKSLPYEWAFERLGPYLPFRGARVDCFGISQYLPSVEYEQKTAAQVHLYDYKGKDDFIIEIDTRIRDHRLILAKVPPAATLKELVETAGRRMAAAKPETGLDEFADLKIPVIDFDVVHDFAELCGQPITSPDPKVAGKRLAAARQAIRFRLDEKGAELTSEVVIATCIARVRDLVFDQPFLVMLKKREAKSPYLVLWIDNPELLGVRKWQPSDAAIMEEILRQGRGRNDH